MFVIVRRRFLRKKILGKAGNLDVKNTTVPQQCIIYWLIRHVS